MAVHSFKVRFGPWRLLPLMILLCHFKLEGVEGYSHGGVFASKRFDRTRHARFLQSDEKLDPTVSNTNLKKFPWETLKTHLSNLEVLSKYESGTVNQSPSRIGEATKDTEEETMSKKKEALEENIKSLQTETSAWSVLGEVVKARLTRMHGDLLGGQTEDNSLIMEENLGESNASKKLSIELIDKKEVLVRKSHELSDFFEAGKGLGGDAKYQYSGCAKAGNGPLYSKPPSLQLDWNPTPGKYLLAICPMGQMSNRIMCFQLYLGMAALINRTLIVPMTDLGSETQYNIRTVFDVPHARKCLGERTVLTVKEYLSLENTKKIRVKVHCLWPGGFKVGACGYKKGRLQVQKRDPRIEVLGRNKAGVIPSNPSLSQFLAAYGNLKDPVVSFGDVLYIGFQQLTFLKNRPNGPLKILDPSCKLIIQANSFLQEIANTIVRDKIGTRFLGIHLRRGDFMSFCEDKKDSCFKPLSQIAACIAAKLNNLGTEIDKIYFAHNAERNEILYLQNAILAQTQGRYTTLELKDVLDFNGPLGHQKVLKKPETIAVLDKMIVARSRVFLGTLHSTFTVDIARMRGGWGTASCLDGTVCDEEGTDSNKIYKEYRVQTRIHGSLNRPFKGAKHR